MADKHAWRYFSGPYLTAAEAIDRGDTAELKATARNLDIDAPGRDHMTLLWYAIVKNQYGAVTALIQLGSNPKAQGAEGLGTPFYVALTRKDPRLLAAMLDGGLSPNPEGSEDTTPLQWAMRGEEPLAVVQVLVARGANVNLRDSIGATALDAAITSDNPDVGIFLVEHGADVNARATNGSSSAFGVQMSIDGLQPKANQATVSDYTLDKNGHPVVSETTPPPQGATPEGQALLRKYEELRALMIAKGAQFPPDSPAQVREQMKIK
ncbi:Ankyrin repeats (3 copies) (plasmid) [Caballeronia sp. SBC1]|uniref:ankyrin repeat domain-containing protein n=1 Tax=unclassified Caballeronia TaxID=2646786 RepID=UPI0013E10A8B|nr:MULTISPECIES: ankyrin repeat domain-containing protein [unclassified Caballeronia]QIE25973.1 Ankyrin repeats (3 copies) [Caballeronia sp. SBC2]QIN64714.1 Ankyrin repeats (3 copies) [Caballeronia sp. SBC1]